MNGIEALAALLAVLVVYGLRDGLLVWWLIHRLIGSRPPALAPAGHPVPAAAPEPAGAGASQPDPAPAKPAPRFTGIVATSFAGGNDSPASRKSAYTSGIIDGDHELGAALPFRFKGQPPTIRVFYQGRTVDAAILDVGPWNTNDPYWTTGARPQAETGTDATKRRTNAAGLDLTPATWAALGYSGDPRNAKASVAWDFADVIDGKAPAGSASLSVGPAPAWLALLRKFRDTGVHAGHDSPIILGWPAAIAATFPEMADYAKGYQHDTTPWCGLTVAYVLAMSGIRPQFGAADTDRFLWAASWLQFGAAVDKPQPGDVMIFQWAGGGHHVTLYDHEEDDAYYHCTGGNQGAGHEVSTEAMAMKSCIGIRRPPTA